MVGILLSVFPIHSTQPHSELIVKKRELKTMLHNLPRVTELEEGPTFRSRHSPSGGSVLCHNGRLQQTDLPPREATLY